MSLDDWQNYYVMTQGKTFLIHYVRHEIYDGMHRFKGGNQHRPELIMTAPVGETTVIPASRAGGMSFDVEIR
jgi:hypothetical protein